MNIKELVEKYLIVEYEAQMPTYTQTSFDKNRGDVYAIGGFQTIKTKMIDINKLCELLSKIVKVKDIVESEKSPN